MPANTHDLLYSLQRRAKVFVLLAAHIREATAADKPKYLLGETLSAPAPEVRAGLIGALREARAAVDAFGYRDPDRRAAVQTLNELCETAAQAQIAGIAFHFGGA